VVEAPTGGSGSAPLSRRNDRPILRPPRHLHAAPPPASFGIEAGGTTVAWQALPMRRARSEPFLPCQSSNCSQSRLVVTCGPSPGPSFCAVVSEWRGRDRADRERIRSPPALPGQEYGASPPHDLETALCGGGPRRSSLPAEPHPRPQRHRILLLLRPGAMATAQVGGWGPCPGRPGQRYDIAPLRSDS
jgi:hypothetical protein